MNCSVCSTEFKPNARFCGVCGATVTIENPGYDNDGMSPENPMVGFGQAIKLGFGKYADFGGRATRAEYWWWQLFCVLVSMIPIIGSIIGLAVFIPSLAVTSRRLHDVGRTGWWQALPWGLFFVFVTSLVGVIIAFTVDENSDFGIILLIIAGISILALIAVGIMLLIWFCMRGQSGSNEYGLDPRTSPRQTL